MIGPLTPGLGSGSLITSPVIPWVMVELIDLSGYVEEGQPVYPGNQRTQFFPTSTHEETGITWKRRNDEETGAISRKFAARRAGSTDEHPNVRSILVSEHGPTHVDSLSHLDPTNDGTIDRIPLERFYGDAVGLDVSHLSPDEYITVETLETALAEADLELRSGDAITLHTGHRQRTYSVDDPEKRYEYLYEFTGLDGEAAEWLVDQGVDVVHGHSAHVLQGVEVYRGRPIIYDAGDFVDDYVDYVDREGVHNKRSALFELVVRDGDLDELRVEPTAIVDEAATLADPAISEWVRDTLAERSAAFGTDVEREDGRLTYPLGAE